MSRSKVRLLLQIFLVIFGIIFGALLGLTGIDFTAGGHGWYGALPEVLSVFILPCSTVSYAIVSPKIRHKLTLVGLVGALIIDGLSVIITLNGGTQYFYKLFHHLPNYVMQWFIAWVIWHIIAINAFILSRRSNKWLELSTGKKHN